jgi:hypothetical protein
VLRNLFQAEAGAEHRGKNLPERPRSGELPALVALVDRQPLEVFRSPALGGLRPGEVVVVGGDPVAVLVGVEQPFGRVALEQDEPAGRGEEALEDGRPGIEILEPDERPAPRVEEVGRAVELMRRVEDVGFDPAGRRPARR